MTPVMFDSWLVAGQGFSQKLKKICNEAWKNYVYHSYNTQD